MSAAAPSAAGTPRQRAADLVDCEPTDIAFEAARAFIQDGYPGVPLDHDPDAYPAACEEALWSRVDQAVAAAGFDLDPEVAEKLEDAIQDAEELATNASHVAYNGGGNGEEMAMYKAFVGPPRPAPDRRFRRVALVPRFHCGIRHRRASRPSAVRRRGSRRGASSARGDPDEPPPHTHGPTRRPRAKHRSMAVDKRVRPVSPLEVVRRKRGLSQADLAREAGCSRPYISLCEGGLVPPRRLRGAIAAALEMPVEELWPSPERDDAPGVNRGAVEGRREDRRHGDGH
jgi:DNA-binding XRE family transcriptional regulator